MLAAARVVVCDMPPPGVAGAPGHLHFSLRMDVSKVVGPAFVPVEANFVRPQDELLQSCLRRMVATLSKKLAQNGPQNSKQAAVTELKLSLRLLDRSGKNLAPETSSAVAWSLASVLLFAELPGHDTPVHLPVFWNPPSIGVVRLSGDAPVVGAPLLAHAELRGCTTDDCTWIWQRKGTVRSTDRHDAINQQSDVSDDWEDVAYGVVYVPVASDEGQLLRVCCRPLPPGDCSYSSPCKHTVAPEPSDDRRWGLIPPAPISPSFRLATYNVLADAYAGTKWHAENLFPYCASGVLSAPRRRQRILRDVLKLDSDLIGLQECDQGQRVALAPLSQAGWEHKYTKKSGAAADGCMLFWRRSRFAAVAEPWEVNLGGDFDKLPGLDESTRAAVSAHRATRGVLTSIKTIAHGVLLQDSLVPGRRLMVANTHLFYHPNANHVRLLQLYMLTNELSRRAKDVEAAGGGPVAVVLLGDLNARKGTFDPRNAGQPPQAAYRLVRDGIIHSDDVDWSRSNWRSSLGCGEDEAQKLNNKTDGGEGCSPEVGRSPDIDSDHENKAPIVVGTSQANFDGSGCDADPLLRLTLQLPLPLIDPNPHIEVTNFTGGFKECLDYTLVDTNAFVVAHQIDPPALELLEAEVALPSKMFPSDHIPVVVDVLWRDTGCVA